MFAAENSVKREPEISLNRSRLNERLETLYEAIDNLENRIQGILKSNLPTPAGMIDKVVDTPQTELGGYLKNKGDEISAMINKVQSIFERVEL